MSVVSTLVSVVGSPALNEQQRKVVRGLLFELDPDWESELRFAILSFREREVIECIMRGLSNNEIGLELGISAQTVNNHVASILRKTGVTDRANVILWVHQFRPIPKRAGLDVTMLTHQQTEVLKFLCRGYSRKEISAMFPLAEQTVKIHLHDIYKKLRVDGRCEAIVRGYHGGIELGPPQMR